MAKNKITVAEKLEAMKEALSLTTPMYCPVDKKTYWRPALTIEQTKQVQQAYVDLLLLSDIEFPNVLVCPDNVDIEIIETEVKKWTPEDARVGRFTICNDVDREGLKMVIKHFFNKDIFHLDYYDYYYSTSIGGACVGTDSMCQIRGELVKASDLLTQIENE